MEYYSIVRSGCDMINEAVSTVIKLWSYPWEQSEYRKKLRIKIVETMKTYESRWFQADWFAVKNLEWPFFEYRTKAWWIKLLVRIFFFQHNQASIVLTWCIIKAENYWDKKTTHEVDQQYVNELSFAKKVQQDFLWKQQFDYQLLSLYT